MNLSIEAYCQVRDAGIELHCLHIGHWQRRELRSHRTERICKKALEAGIDPEAVEIIKIMTSESLNGDRGRFSIDVDGHLRVSCFDSMRALVGRALGVKDSQSE